MFAGCSGVEDVVGADRLNHLITRSDSSGAQEKEHFRTGTTDCQHPSAAGCYWVTAAVNTPAAALLLSNTVDLLTQLNIRLQHDVRLFEFQDMIESRFHYKNFRYTV